MADTGPSVNLSFSKIRPIGHEGQWIGEERGFNNLPENKPRHHALAEGVPQPAMLQLSGGRYRVTCNGYGFRCVLLEQIHTDDAGEKSVTVAASFGSDGEQVLDLPQAEFDVRVI